MVAAMETLLDWLNLLVRWFHLTIGIAWIGASFYFVWLDNHLERPAPGAPRGVGGELWSVHGGGFYHKQKYTVAPERLPETLHWFKWEAYFTWLSGFALMILVYYVGAETYLVDTSVMELPVWAAIAISLATLLIGWIVYDALCRSPLGANEPLFAAIGFFLVVALAWGLGDVFSGRGAYIHVGAMLGTIMAANVLMVIIPGQRRMVAAMKAGRAPDPADGIRGKQRSLHNNYITLPVLFLMVSNHYPITYGHPQAWAVLALIVAASVLFRHFLNLRHKGRTVVWLPAASAALVVLLVLWTLPRPVALPAGAKPVHFAEVQSIVNDRCLACHATRPTYDGIVKPPQNVVLERPEQIRRWAARVNEHTVVRRTMPAGNVTNMTDEERQVIGLWYQGGARLD
jgi:uncharacterized membrane protein